MMTHRPDYSCKPTGKRLRRTVVAVAAFVDEHVALQVVQRRRVPLCPYLRAVEHRPRPMNEQRSQVRVPALGDAAETSLLAAARLTRCQAQPRREARGITEQRRVRRCGDYRDRGEQSHCRHPHQVSGIGLGVGVALELTRDRGNVPFQVPHFCEHLEQQCTHRVGDLGLGIFDQLRNPGQCCCCPLWNNNPELAQQIAHQVDACLRATHPLNRDTMLPLQRLVLGDLHRHRLRCGLARVVTVPVRRTPRTTLAHAESTSAPRTDRVQRASRSSPSPTATKSHALFDHVRSASAPNISIGPVPLSEPPLHCVPSGVLLGGLLVFDTTT